MAIIYPKKFLKERKGKMRALICLDLVNDLVHPEGKLTNDRGYSKFIEEHNSLETIARVQEQFRQTDAMVVHFRVGFGEGYPELSESSPIFSELPKSGALQLGTWGTELHELVRKQAGEPAINKHRISPFYRTRLDLILRTQNVEEVFICGVATNLAVASAAREAHDHDYKVTVISDACVASSNDVHEAALTSIEPFGTVAPFSKIAVGLTAA
jgi:nicotinamidase-related amidase